MKARPVAAPRRPGGKPRPQPRESGAGVTAGLALGLCAATLFLYWPALRYPLHFDDLELFGAPDKIRRATFALDPRWVTHATFYLTSLFAKDDWFWYRLGNIVLHALTACLLF